MALVRSFTEVPIKAAEASDRFEHRDTHIDQLKLDGRVLDLEIAKAIIGATVNRTMDGASTVKLAIHDPRGVVRQSPAIAARTILTVDGYRYALCKIQKTGTTLSLTFEDAAVAALRLVKKPKKANRAKFTRAQFIKMMCAEIKTEKIRFFAPELLKRQPIAPRERTETQAARDERREPGFPDDIQITVKGVISDKAQKTNITKVLAQGVEMGVPKKLLICAIMVVTQESTARNLTAQRANGPVGLFQQIRKWGWPASRVPETDAAAFYNKALISHNSNTGMDHDELCEAVQKSGRPELYALWKDEATATVESFNGTSLSERAITVNKPYEFTRGEPGGPKDENSWDAMGRLASQVNWRRFMSNGTLYFISDDRLIQSRPRMTVVEGKDTVEDFDFDHDIGKPASIATFTIRAWRWGLPPGSVVLVSEQGAGNGRWIVASIERSLFSRETKVTLKRKEPKLKEPTNDTEQLGTSGLSSDIRRRIVEAAEKALKANRNYIYGQVRPYPSSLFNTTDAPAGGVGPIRAVRTDCSGFATLCFKAAGAKDPNRLNYNGSGYTGTLTQHGRWTDSPRPGDLAFYGGTKAIPGHVAVYIGDGMCIGFGSNPIKKHTLRYRTDYQGVMTYELEP